MIIKDLLIEAGDDLALYSTSLTCVDTAVPTTRFEYQWIPSNLQEIKDTPCIVGTSSFLGMRTLKMRLEHTQKLKRRRANREIALV